MTGLRQQREREGAQARPHFDDHVVGLDPGHADDAPDGPRVDHEILA
jgi:hypothetical protein